MNGSGVAPAADLADRRAAERAAVDARLDAFCDRYLGGVHPTVASAIRYALLGGGKRLRAGLVLAAHRAAGGSGDATGIAAAVEVVHAYSLVHDDLPCMDDDDVRRGRPTVHRAFGVPAATAAGLAMVPLAALAAYDAVLELGLGPADGAVVVRELMRASGAEGMVGGQLLDLLGEGHRLSLRELERIHAGKTGALIAGACRVGAIAASARPGVADALGHYGAAIGLAFQIADDVLDVTATTAELGKTAGRDLDLAKSTYPALLGVDGARARADALVADACATLSAANLLTPELEQLARFSVARRS